MTSLPVFDKLNEGDHSSCGDFESDASYYDEVEDMNAFPMNTIE
jgi:hypothetical protein